MNIHKKLLASIFALMLFPSLALADFTGRCIKVKDGDTIAVLYKKDIQVNIRLNGIDAPELKQPYGIDAKRYAKSLVYDKNVTVRDTGMDNYGRTMAWIVLPDGRDFSEEMLKAGYAWHYSQYDHSQKLADLEQAARDAQVGLWADFNPTPPWDFRHEEEALKDIKLHYRYRRPRAARSKSRENAGAFSDQIGPK